MVYFTRLGRNESLIKLTYFGCIIWFADGLNGIKIHVKPNQLILVVVYITQFDIMTICSVNGRGFLDWFYSKTLHKFTI